MPWQVTLEGGMDDHITKPIDPNILFSTLKKWIKPGAREIPKYLAEKIASESKNNELESLPKSPGIDSVVGLSRVGGNEKLYRSLLVKFHDDYTDTTEQIKEALLKEDLELVTFLAHTIKGVAGNLGANDLQSVAGDIEHSANGATLEKINQQLTNFDENFSLFS